MKWLKNANPQRRRASVSLYRIAGGKFEQAFNKLAATGWGLNLQSAPRPGKNGTNNSKSHFNCTQCGQNAWGKPDLGLRCETCAVQALAELGVAAKIIKALVEAVKMRPAD